MVGSRAIFKVGMCYLGAGDHHAVVEAQMQHSLTVVDQRVYHLPGYNVPHSYCRITAPAYDYLIIILKTQH